MEIRIPLRVLTMAGAVTSWRAIEPTRQGTEERKAGLSVEPIIKVSQVLWEKVQIYPELSLHKGLFLVMDNYMLRFSQCTCNQIHYLIVHGNYLRLLPPFSPLILNFALVHLSENLCSRSALLRAMRYVFSVILSISICVSVHFAQYVAVGRRTYELQWWLFFRICHLSIHLRLSISHCNLYHNLVLSNMPNTILPEV